MSSLLAHDAPIKSWLAQASLSTLAELALAFRAELISRGSPGARGLDEVAHVLTLYATAQRAASSPAAEHERAPIYGADCSRRSE